MLKSPYLSPMKTTIYLITIFSLGLLNLPTTFAQRPVKQYYKNDGAQVRREKEADFIRILQKEKRSDTHYNLTEYYPDQQIKRTGRVPDLTPPLLFEGQVVSYYPNGNKKLESHYVKGQQVGTSTYYYENGQMHKVVKHAIPQFSLLGTKNTIQPPDTLLWFYEPQGAIKVAEGNGFVRETDNEQDYEEGEYRNGVREGEWRGTFLKQKYSFSEKYSGGYLVSGVSIDENNQKTPYKELMIAPTYGSGAQNSVDQFRMSVQRIFTIPSLAIRAQAGGLISVEFVIDEKGETTEFKLLQDPGHGLGQEAINAIKLAGKWTPGINRGVPVRVKQVLPLRISVQTRPDGIRSLR